ncbi:hypothetical protein GEO84_13595 [Salmonella enterica subsp. enterica serovar Anatum]|nr:hypothetical protein [Salmonella enterica subsp. enterica serovar Anatum]
MKMKTIEVDVYLYRQIARQTKQSG